MRKLLAILLSCVLLAPAQVWAASGATTVQATDAGSTARTFNVDSTTGAVTGNLSWMNTICDFTTLTQCATVTSGGSLQVGGQGTAGSAAGGVVTVQGVTSMTPVQVSQATAASLNATVVGTGTFATQVNGFTSWAGSTLGAIANYGTSPGAVLVPGVNAFVTNANANGQATMANSSPVTIASDQVGTCTLHGFKHITSATDTLAVQGVAAQTIRLCAWTSRAAGVATWFFENTASANANCSSSNTQINGVATEAANTGEVVALPLGVTLNNTSGNGLCINSTGTGGVDIDFWYAQR